MGGFNSSFSYAVLAVSLWVVNSARADSTWSGATNNNFSNSGNWSVGGVPITGNGSENQVLTFGTESGGSPDYTVTLDQGKSGEQNVAAFLITGGTGYTFDANTGYSYITNGIVNDGSTIVNSSGYMVTFDVDIAQNSNSGFDENIWDAGTGGLTFDGTISFANKAKNLALENGEFYFNNEVSISNTTGSSTIVYAADSSTVYISGTLGIEGDNAGLHGIGIRGGTMLLDGPTGVDLIQDSDNNARGTRLQMEGGTFGFTDEDSEVRLASFYRALTMTEDSVIQFGDDVGGGIISFIDTNSAASDFGTSLLSITNWNGTEDVGGGTDQFVFAQLYSDGSAVSVGDSLWNVTFEYKGATYSSLVVASPTYPGMMEIVPGGIILPEPSTYAMGGVLLCAMGYFEVRRRKKLAADRVARKS
ncbi:hypothetical protein [Cerasicoccus maritimus]|uniref:hypothetical protein n=1 Tax=Cerasicoccus maritimus TaxID=490089 RepID=UPI002852BDC1|nr:hypothetical protein [Cerasicoccus maritimus]